VRAAVLADPELTERQKQVLLEIYESFRRELAARAADDAEAAGAEPAGIESGGMESGGMEPGEPGPNGEASQPEPASPDLAELTRPASPVQE
jgi:hypothetical protein